MFCKAIILAGLAFTNPSKPDGDQPIDTIAIEGIIVNSKLQRYSSSLSVRIIPSVELKQYKQLLLSDLVGSISNVTINNYGPGGIATASLRGLGTFHTAVLWNGINLQSSMNGNVNLSSIPVNFIDQVAIQYGGNGALFGSGAIGGTIHIDNLLDFGKGHSTEVFQSFGSFQSIFSGINYTYSGLKVATSTRIFYSEAENDFRFHNIAAIGSPYMKQENSNSSKLGLLENIALQISPKDYLSTSIWLQKSFNRYPPMMTASTNNEHERWANFRGVVQWKANRKYFDFNIKGGLFKDFQFYNDTVRREKSKHYSNLGVFEGESIFKISPNHKIETGLNLNFESISSTNYPEIEKRFRPSISTSYRFYAPEGKYEAFASVREEMVNNTSTPITWSIGSKINFLRVFTLRSNISKNYRVPTMNDLYWSGGWGNPNLKPEMGYGEELGLDFISRVNNRSIIVKINAFNNNVSNWIIWMPNGSKWSPSNMKKVWARGLDINLSYAKNIQKWIWGVDLTGTGTLSTSQKTNAETSETSGKQLPYVPKIKANGSLFIDYKKFRVNYSLTYTGKRYTIADNSRHINPFTISNLTIEKLFEGKSFSIKTFLRIDNLFNKEYQVMAWYPMPLRSYQFGVSILFNKPIH
jgi:vitamin B12 transporter